MTMAGGAGDLTNLAGAPYKLFKRCATVDTDKFENRHN
jgi:hypothetical protein